MSDILEAYADKINGHFTFFDRMIIAGNLLYFINDLRVNNLYTLGISLKYFKEQTMAVTSQIDHAITSWAKNANREIRWLPSSDCCKEDIAREVMQRDQIEEGLICILKVNETCISAKVYGSDEGRLILKTHNTKCHHYYCYMQDRQYGFMFVKIQSWFPYTITVYMNGRELMKNTFAKNGIHSEMYDNSFSYLSDIEKAQKLADNFDSKKLERVLAHFAHIVNPWVQKYEEAFECGYYWTVKQCEIATDIMFKRREALEDIYPSLVDHAFHDLRCTDIFSFMGRKLAPQFLGEAVSDYKKRPVGWRVKFKLTPNHIKMYDKANCLRIETTINDPKEFKVFKEVHHKDGTTDKQWVPMSKGISNLYRYLSIGQACNFRFAHSLENIVPVKSTQAEIERICMRTEDDGQVFTGLNVWNPTIYRAFCIIADGSFILSGITNVSIRDKLFPELNEKQRARKTSRFLRKLRAHHILKKVRKSRKYYLTDKGRRIISALILTHERTFPEAMGDICA